MARTYSLALSLVWSHRKICSSLKVRTQNIIFRTVANRWTNKGIFLDVFRIYNQGYIVASPFPEFELQVHCLNSPLYTVYCILMSQNSKCSESLPICTAECFASSSTGSALTLLPFRKAMIRFCVHRYLNVQREAP